MHTCLGMDAIGEWGEKMVLASVTMPRQPIPQTCLNRAHCACRPSGVMKHNFTQDGLVKSHALALDITLQPVVTSCLMVKKLARISSACAL